MKMHFINSSTETTKFNLEDMEFFIKYDMKYNITSKGISYYKT